MSIINKVLFFININIPASILLFASRILFGASFMTHGLQNWNSFTAISDSFPDPLGIGNQESLVLVIFAELVCPVLLILGFLHRLTLIPMIFTMSIAFFEIHNTDPFAMGEPSFLYLSIFTILLFTGPGRFSIDYLIARNIHKRRRSSNYGAYSHIKF